MKLSLRVVFFTAVVLASAVAHASTVKYINTASSEARNGAFAGFYTLKIDGQTVFGMCDDRATNVGSTWNANIYGYSTINGGSGKFGSNTVAYSRAGWLFSQAPAASSTDQASIDEAIWKVMNPGVTITAAAQPYYTAATSGTHDSYNWSNDMLVVTPEPFSASQEFLITPGSVPPSSIVPLPSSVWLLFSGVIGLVAVSRRNPRVLIPTAEAARFASS